MKTMTGYQVQVSGRGEWAGVALSSGRWMPACGGTLNGTGRSDEFASTFNSEEEATEILRQMVHGGSPCEGTEFRVVKVQS